MTKRITGLLVLMLVVATSCTSTASPSAPATSGGESASPAAESLTFALINGVLTGDQSVCAFDGVKKVLTAAGHTFVESSSVYNAEDEIRNVNAAISQGVDAMIVWDAFPQSGVRDVEAANAANIPIYLWFNEVPNVQTQVLGGSYYDFRGAGVAVGNWIQDNVTDPVIMELTGSPGSGTAEAISQGIDDVLGAGGVKLRQNANWDNDQAAQLASTLLPANPDVNLIVTHNDGMALAVLRIVEQLGLQDSVQVITESVSSPEGIAAIEDGSIPMPAVDPLAEYGVLAAQHAIDLLAGTTDEKFRLFGPSHIDPANPGDFCLH
jgi:ABC-type sugar transport system substrate-binding protein